MRIVYLDGSTHFNFDFGVASIILGLSGEGMLMHIHFVAVRKEVSLSAIDL